MSASRDSDIFTILDIPTEILIKIIFNLNPVERITLGNSCKRFHSLVFEEKELLRDLDFSEDKHLISAFHIGQYFNNIKTSKHILKLNIKNIKCMDSTQMLGNYIRKAINLVDINIHGITFENIQELANFSTSLSHVERLSIDWPKEMENDFTTCYKALRKLFSQLTYLSVKVLYKTLSNDFIRYLNFAQKLKELHMVGRPPCVIDTENESVNAKSKILKNLEIIGFSGFYSEEEKKFFLSMLPNPEEWTECQAPSYYVHDGFYLEKNLLCKELKESNLTSSVLNLTGSIEVGQSLTIEHLLNEVIKITHEDVPKKFCCLPLHLDTNMCMMKLDEEKQLLKNPRYKLRYLRINHDIETDCDVHLLGSAFPSLTELFLSNITKVSDCENKHPYRHLKKKDGTVPQDGDDLKNINGDSSFKMLIENTPHVRALTLDPFYGSINNDKTHWDLAALNLISGWKNLTALHLSFIPIEDGGFLIEIGKQCKNLEILSFNDLGIADKCCYIDELLQMLPNCTNLRKFKLQQPNIGRIDDVLNSLANNTQLRSVHLISDDETDCNIDLIPSIENLFHSCSKLTKFQCIIDDLPEIHSIKMTSVLERLKSELNRPNLQFQVVWSMDLIIDNTELDSRFIPPEFFLSDEHQWL